MFEIIFIILIIVIIISNNKNAGVNIKNFNNKKPDIYPAPQKSQKNKKNLK